MAQPPPAARPRPAEGAGDRRADRGAGGRRARAARLVGGRRRPAAVHAAALRPRSPSPLLAAVLDGFAGMGFRAICRRERPLRPGELDRRPPRRARLRRARPSSRSPTTSCSPTSAPTGDHAGALRDRAAAAGPAGSRRTSSRGRPPRRDRRRPPRPGDARARRAGARARRRARGCRPGAGARRAPRAVAAALAAAVAALEAPLASSGRSSPREEVPPVADIRLDPPSGGVPGRRLGRTRSDAAQSKWVDPSA